MQTERQQAKPAFPTGRGQKDTRAKILSDDRANPSQHAGQPYATVTGQEIAKMMKNPSSGSKDKGQWFIPSTYRHACSNEGQ
jgi:hypothetical protein